MRLWRTPSHICLMESANVSEKIIQAVLLSFFLKKKSKRRASGPPTTARPLVTLRASPQLRRTFGSSHLCCCCACLCVGIHSSPCRLCALMMPLSGIDKRFSLLSSSWLGINQNLCNYYETMRKSVSNNHWFLSQTFPSTDVGG